MQPLTDLKRLSNRVICDAALDGDRINWSMVYAHQSEVFEAQSRKLDIANCRRELGLVIPTVVAPGEVSRRTWAWQRAGG